MAWHPDNPDIPIRKPRALSKLEKMDFHTLQAMPPVEVDEVCHDVAQGVAEEYHKEKGGSYEECVSVVSVALTTTGSAIGGHVGDLMIGQSDSLASHACRAVFHGKEAF